MIKKIHQISGNTKNSFGSAKNGKGKIFHGAVNTQIIWKLFPEEKFNFNEFFMPVEIEVSKGREEKQTMQIIYKYFIEFFCFLCLQHTS